jgi:hypothetical protein
MSYTFFGGMLAAGYWVATLFFLRFWLRTGMRVFAWFAAGFAMLGLQPFMMWVIMGNAGDEAELYLFRLAGFFLIIVGVASANRRKPGQPRA